MSSIVESREFWEHQLGKLKASGLSRLKYCRDNKINYDRFRFSYWLKKLSPMPSSFVAVKLHEADTPTSILCTLELSGYLLKIHDLSALSFVLERLV